MPLRAFPTENNTPSIKRIDTELIPPNITKNPLSSFFENILEINAACAEPIPGRMLVMLAEKMLFKKFDC